ALDQLSNAQEKIRAFGCGSFRPIAKGFLRCGDRKVNVACIAIGHLRIGLTCSRFDVVEVSAADWFDEFAVDEVANSKLLSAHATENKRVFEGSRIATAQGVQAVQAPAHLRFLTTRVR